MRWRPDICQGGQCEIEIASDEADMWTPQQPFKFLKSCPVHSPAPDDSFRLAQIKKEMQARNFGMDAVKRVGTYTLTTQDKFLLGLLLRVMSGSAEPVQIPDAVIHPDKGVTHVFDAQRDSVFEVAGFSQSELATALTEAQKIDPSIKVKVK